LLAVLPAGFGSAAGIGPSASETALAYVVAKAGGADPETVRGWRVDGGSWGVVAALARADVAAISAALDAFLTPGGVPVVAVGPVSPVGPTGGAADGGTAVAPSPSSGGRPSARPSPRPSPSSSPDPVQDIVTTVTHLLPTPTPVSVPIGASPSASPLVKVGVGSVDVSVG
jgi:hypothetical protein